MTESQLAIEMLDSLGRRLSDGERYARNVPFSEMIVWRILCGRPGAVGPVGHVSYDMSLRDGKGGFILGIVTVDWLPRITRMNERALSGFQCMEALAEQSPILAKKLAVPVNGTST